MPEKRDSTKDEAILKEIRDRHEYHCESWREIWDDGNLDMKYLSGDPWDETERKIRKKYNRPCLVFDELQQHVNQTVNELRMNKLAIKITPEGGGAQQEHAELRQNRIRKIEYESKAQTAYLRAYEDMISRSYGYFGLITEYCNGCEGDLKLKIRMFPNPNAVSLDPDAREAAAADGMDAFVIDRIPIKRFKYLYGKNAVIQDFTAEHREAAPKWITDDTVQVAEYWKVEEGTRNVKQYLLDGVEILEERDWPGSWIPIFPMFGKEMYVEKGGQTKRLLLSRVRNARDPFMHYCYVRSAQAELIRMTPKFPYLGVKGQFATESDWEHMNDIPTAYAEYNATTEATGSAILGPPTRQPYEPAIAALEMMAEADKRAIQSAFGSFNASVGKEDTHARSGVAIKALQGQTSQGTYHFVDSDVVALEQAGRCINELLDIVDRGPRDVGIMKPDETSEMVRINDPSMGPEQMKTYGQGDFGVMVSVGPSYQSQREEAAAFLDTLISNLQAMPFAPEVKSKLLSLAIKLKSLGPIGDEMAKLLDPAAGQDGIPPQAQAKMQEMQQIIQAMQQQLEQLARERDAKVLELESRERIAATQADVDKTKIQADVDIALAKIGASEGMEALKQDFALLQARIEHLYAVEEAAAEQSELLPQ